jgi:hypothetical protein
MQRAYQVSPELERLREAAPRTNASLDDEVTMTSPAREIVARAVAVVGQVLAQAAVQAGASTRSSETSRGGSIRSACRCASRSWSGGARRRVVAYAVVSMIPS